MKAAVTRLLQGTPQAALFACLLFGVATVAAAPMDVQVYHKTDGILVVLNLDGAVVQDVCGGRIWIEYVPHTVWKNMPDGSVWIQDCDNNAAFTIGTGGKENEKPTTVRYEGSGSIIDIGFWVDQGGGWLGLGAKMNFQIKAEVVDAVGQVYKLRYHATAREGVWDEDFNFEPVK